MDPEIDDIVDAAEALLSRRFGGTQQLSGVEELGGSDRSVVLRARVAHSPFLPHRSVIVKHVPVTGSPVDDAALVREIVAYQFTNSLAEEVRPGPVLLAHDVDQRIVVLTDLGSSSTLIDALHGASEDDRVALFRSLGGALGRLHAGTAGKDAAFDVLLRRQLKRHPNYAASQTLRDDALDSSIPLGIRVLQTAGVDVPDEVRDMAAAARKSLRSSRELAFTPFDLSPDNVIYADRIHLLDYEWAGFRNVAFDLGSVISGFPQYLFVSPVTDREVDTFLTAWTREIREVWPKLAEPAHQKESVLTALVGWAMSSLATMSLGGLEHLSAFLEDSDGFNAPTSVDPGADSVSTVHAVPTSGIVSGAHLLRTVDRTEFSDDELLIRRDLYESFEALARYAAAFDGSGPDDEVNGAHRSVARFAAEVATRLGTPKN